LDTLINGESKNIGQQDLQLSASAIVRPTQIVVEKFTDPEGSDQEFNFTITRNPGSVLINEFNLTDGMSNTTDVDHTTNGNKYEYSVVEADTPGWLLTNVTCVGTVQNQTASNLNFEIAEGEVVVCTFENEIQESFLKLVKEVDNGDGGNAAADDWTLFANASNPSNSTNDFSNLGGSGLFTKILPDIAYNLTESGPSDYTAGLWSCDDGTQVGNQITLIPGQNATCTINNDDDAPYLKLVKNVQNNSGGNATADDWTLNATADTDNERNFSTDGGSGNFELVFANNTYTLDEDMVEGYSSDGIWNCNGGNFTSPDKIQIPLGTNVTCTITNTDDPPMLRLVKDVQNDAGGNATADDWTLNATASDDTDTSFSNAGGSGTPQVVFANNTYTLSEEGGPSGYSSDLTWSCNGGSMPTNSSVIVGLGENVTCTIINQDVAPYLKLVKEVINDDGGNASAGNWTLFANSNNVANNTKDFANAGDAGVLTEVFANIVYNLTESEVDGYVFDGWECVDDNTNSTIPTSNQVTLDLGQNVTCTVTNNDVPAFLKIIKNTTDDSFDDRNFSFKFFITDANGKTTSENVVVPGGNHTGMSDIIMVPTGTYLYIGSALGSKGAMSLSRRLVRHATRTDPQAPQAIRPHLIETCQAVGLGQGDLRPRQGKRLFWNVDHLLDQPAVSLTHIIAIRSQRRLEAQLGQLLEKEPVTRIIEKGLGANDVTGNTHLLRVVGDEAWWAELPDKCRHLADSRV